MATVSAAAAAPGADPDAADDVRRTRILLAGLRRSGKTSIQQVLFHKMAPKQAFYVEPTQRITRHKYDTIIPLEIWDCPGTIEPSTVDLTQFAALIFVIDIQDLYQAPISRLIDFIIKASEHNPALNLEVFVHKTEPLSDDYKIENFRQIQQRTLDELLDESEDYAQIPVNFHLTSVYDHSLHEAFSRVLQNKLVESLPYLEDLLNVFVTNSQSSKAFLFDIESRIYVATDASPVDAATYNLCCDYLKMLTSFGPLYKSAKRSPARCQATSTSASALPEPAPESSVVQSPSTTSATLTSTTSGGSTPKTSTSASPSSSAQNEPNAPLGSHESPDPDAEAFWPSASTSLLPTTTITYHLITPQLALLAVLPTSVYEKKRGLVEYNVVCFREGVQEICAVEREARAA